MRPSVRHLRERVLFAIAFAILGLASVGFGPPRLTDSAQPVDTLTPTGVAAIRDFPEPPELTARNAVIMDGASGHVVWGLREHERIAPASTTKILTALLALERGNLNDQITVRYEHVRPLEGTDSSLMGLVIGDRISLEQLLYGLMVASGNDAALVIAHLIAGSAEEFVGMMNQKVAELGLRNTHFTNPHGLDDDDHYSSAYDLAEMGRIALRNPVFAKIVATSRIEIDASRTFVLANTNRLLSQGDLYPGFNGIKTGTTERAGDSIVASVTRNGRTVIIAAMGTRGREPDTVQLADMAFEAFRWVRLPTPVFANASGTSANGTASSTPQWVMVAPWDVDRISIERMYGAAGPSNEAFQYTLPDGWSTTVPVGLN